MFIEQFTKLLPTVSNVPADQWGAPDAKSLITHLTRQPHTVTRDPFPHVVIDNAFPDAFNAELNRFFKNNLYRGLTESDDKDRFSRFGDYDAYGWNPNPRKTTPAQIFFSTEWRGFFAGLFQKKVTNDTIVNFHHHKPGSEGGDSHTDYAACSFKSDPLPNGVNPWFHHCKHQTDEEIEGAFKRVRAIALIYYLSSNLWFPEYGGETALYSSEDTHVPAKKIAPLNNRLLAFEVTPYSYHAFVQNKHISRDNVIQWFHVAPENAIACYGKTPGHIKNKNQ